MSKCDTMEVYICKKDGEIVYIGKGRKGRHKHCNSGTSHVYELNEIHFKEGSNILETEVVKYFKTDEEATILERLLIQKYKPAFNKVFTGRCSRALTSSGASSLKRDMLKYISDMGFKNQGGHYEKYYKLVDEFLSQYGYDFYRKDDFLIYGAEFYRDMNLGLIANLSRCLRGDGYNSKDSYATIFKSCVEDLYGIDLSCFVTKRLDQQ